MLLDMVNVKQAVECLGFLKRHMSAYPGLLELHPRIDDYDLPPTSEVMLENGLKSFVNQDPFRK